jgi:hypothetical protein
VRQAGRENEHCALVLVTVTSSVRMIVPSSPSVPWIGICVYGSRVEPDDSYFDSHDTCCSLLMMVSLRMVW